MNIYTELRAWLLAKAGVIASVGDRMYPVFIPGGATYPALRFERDGEERTRDFDGQGVLVGSSVQIDAVADTLAEAVTAAGSVKAELLNYRGAMGGLSIQRADLDANFETWDSSIEKWRASQSWTIWHNDEG